jgi:AcrR family transcriptional regulator
VTVMTLASMTAAVITYNDSMGRWEPNARGRLEEAAIELYAERGFDQTTVAEIAQRAGLTERTFFRYFPDKCEVLFSAEGVLHDLFVRAVAGAPDSASPIEAVATGLMAASIFFEGRTRERVRQRYAVIAAHARLQERDLITFSRFAAGMAGALRQRGVATPAASLAAETGMVVLKVAIQRWADDTSNRLLAQHIRESLDELKALAGG